VKIDTDELEWVPQASIAYPSSKRDEKMQLKYPVSLKWHVLINNNNCTWGLSYIPPSLVLSPRDDPERVLAQFTYAGYGNQARNGQVVGFLRILENADEQVEIMSTVSAVVAHWKGAGKFLTG
jgi:hypothetical protein